MVANSSRKASLTPRDAPQAHEANAEKCQAAWLGTAAIESPLTRNAAKLLLNGIQDGTELAVYAPGPDNPWSLINQDPTSPPGTYWAAIQYVVPVTNAGKTADVAVVMPTGSFNVIVSIMLPGNPAASDISITEIILS